MNFCEHCKLKQATDKVYISDENNYLNVCVICFDIIEELLQEEYERTLNQ